MGLTEEDRELVKNLGGVGVRFGGFERESHLSLALRGGREEARTNEQVGATNDDHSWSLELARGREGEREERGREGGMA